METKNYCVIYNPHSQNGLGKEKAVELLKTIDCSEVVDMTTIESYEEFFSSRQEENILICGGDGTLNRFINDTASLDLKNHFFYYACGSGNDFLRDIERDASEIISIDEYIKDLPVCTIDGKDYKFINGIGFGVDGYCCEVGDKIRAEKPNTKINYTSIAIKGLLFYYKPTNATVTVDGVQHKFKKVWIAPTMNGRFYGGGIMPTPNQNRLNEAKDISVMVFHGTGKLKTLLIFPSLFKGEHVNKEKAISIFTGKEITVEFDEPRALQVDGETLLGVTKYSVRSAKAAPVEEKLEEQTI